MSEISSEKTEKHDSDETIKIILLFLLINWVLFDGGSY